MPAPGKLGFQMVVPKSYVKVWLRLTFPCSASCSKATEEKLLEREATLNTVLLSTDSFFQFFSPMLRLKTIYFPFATCTCKPLSCLLDLNCCSEASRFELGEHSAIEIRTNVTTNEPVLFISIYNHILLMKTSLTSILIILLATSFAETLCAEVKHYPALSPEFSYHGRYYTQDGQVKYDWSCFKVDFCFNASKVEWLGEDTWNIYQVNVDGKAVKKIEPKKETKLTLFEASSPESHCLELIKITENQYGPLMSRKDSAFKGVDVSNGVITKKQSTTSLKFEFLGDSLTTAFGADSGRQITCMLHMRSIQNCMEGWASLLSQMFNADFRIQAISGKGLVKNNYGIPGQTMQYLFTRTTSNSKDYSYRYQDGWVPDILFINIGSNDYGRAVKPSVRRFVETFKATTEDTLRKQFQATGRMSKIVAICGQDQPKKLCFSIQEGVREMNYEYRQVYYLEMPKGTWTKDTDGCIQHPNPKGHEKMAKALEEGVRKILLE